MNLINEEEMHEYVKNLPTGKFFLLKNIVRERDIEEKRRIVKHAEEAINDILFDLRDKGVMFDNEAYTVSLEYDVEEDLVFPQFE